LSFTPHIISMHGSHRNLLSSPPLQAGSSRYIKISFFARATRLSILTLATVILFPVALFFFLGGLWGGSAAVTASKLLRATQSSIAAGRNRTHRRLNLTQGIFPFQIKAYIVCFFSWRFSQSCPMVMSPLGFGFPFIAVFSM